MLHAPPPQCSQAAAHAAIAAAPSLRDLLVGGGPDRLICADLTGDAEAEMTVAISSGGTAGDIAWAVFGRRDGRWRLVHAEIGVYKVALRRVGRDIVDTQPVYRKNDPNCCPTGGWLHRRFHWDGRRFAVVRRWHDRKQ